MQVIAINGYPGAGKSTVSELLLKDEENRKVVHTDHLLDKLRNVLPKNNTVQYKRDTGEEIKFIDRESLLYKLSRLNKINDIYNFFKFYYMKREIKKIIADSVKANVEYLIIEGAYLADFADFSDFSTLILVKAIREDRKNRILYRDRNMGVNQEILFEENTINIDFNEEQYNYIVNNTGTLEELSSNVAEISKDIKDKQILCRKKQ